MGIALIIVGGIVLATFFPSLFDYLNKKQKTGDVDLQNKVGQIEKRMAALEERIFEKDEKIRQLESEVSFVTKLIEDKQS